MTKKAGKHVENARKKVEAEKMTLRDIAAGKLDTSWVDATLRRLGCGT